MTENLGMTQIRRADDGDLDAVTDLRVAFLAEHNGLDVAGLGDLTSSTKRFLRQEHRERRAATWVAEDDDRVVGLVTLLLQPKPPRHDDDRTVEGYAINLYVVPDARRHGIARELLRGCVEEAPTLGVRRLVLHATDAGRPLYESLGFEPNARWLELPLPRQA
jgi:GNAT superfamily N-acetyltransferase